MWRQLTVVVTLCLLAASPVPGGQQPGVKDGATVSSSPPIEIKPIGWVKRQGDRSLLELRPEVAPALEGLAGFSHVWVFFWFHENDRPEERAILKVHPRRDPANPLTGVFATRAPVRPNLIGLTACRIVSVKGNVLEVEGLDAREGSPILDLKPYIPRSDALPEAQVPWWVKKIGEGD
jgi:tRNA-Thr(GGU) m(6)t(6)A37 methyltransferase TsaA